MKKIGMIIPATMTTVVFIILDSINNSLTHTINYVTCAFVLFIAYNIMFKKE